MKSGTIKSWTARRPVKILCVVLIPVLLFISSIGLTGIAGLNQVSVDILFANLGKNDYFFDKYVYDALSQAQTAFWLQSEENIRSMGCLEWQLVYSYYYPDLPSDLPTDLPPEPHESYEYDNLPYETDSENPVAVAPPAARYAQYGLKSTNRVNQWFFGVVNAEDLDSAEAQQITEDAIQRQLGEFYYAENYLETMPGVYYIITDGARWVGNITPGNSMDFFRLNPVYYISENGKAPEYSRNDNSGTPYLLYNDYYDSYYDSDNISSYIAFTSEAVDWQNNVWRTAQRQLEIQLAIIAGPLVAAFALFIILLVGAGRRYGFESGTVSFMIIDKPWLDLGFCFVLGYELAVGYTIYIALETAWRYENVKWLTILFAVASIVLSLPALWWTSGLTKRCKAGKFWRHTMCYVIFRRIFSGIKKTIMSLWAGTRLTARVMLLGLALVAGMIICFIVGLTRDQVTGLLLCFAFSAFAVFLMLRYSRKIHILEQGAKAASGGHYDEPIAVTGGELGSIAVSINNISDGINSAVAERMKSERLKTELITNISHDIRTPLTSLITYTDLLKSEGLDNEKAPDYLEILVQKSARLKTLTEDLFEASKAASGNIDVHIENLDFADLVRQILGEMDERVSDSGLDFRLTLPEHAAVRADGKLLWRVIDNLLSNVFKYALPGSRVYIDIAQENESHRLDIKNVSEHPLNIDPSELTERFKRGDESRGGEGSGLGLSIAQSFTEAQGGQFSLSIDGDLFKASIRLPARTPNLNLGC